MPKSKPRSAKREAKLMQKKITAAELAVVNQRMAQQAEQRQRDVIAQATANVADTLFRQLSVGTDKSIAITMSLATRYAIESTGDAIKGAEGTAGAQRVADVRAHFLNQAQLCWDDQLGKARVQLDIAEKMRAQMEQMQASQPVVEDHQGEAAEPLDPLDGPKPTANEIEGKVVEIRRAQPEPETPAVG